MASKAGELSRKDFETLSQLFLASKTLKWEEAYQNLGELEYAGKKEFYSSNTESSMEVYDEMMSNVQDALISDEEYDLSVEETTNAFLYAANQNPNRDEFRRAAAQVIEGKSRWEDYANQSI